MKKNIKLIIALSLCAMIICGCSIRRNGNTNQGAVESETSESKVEVDSSDKTSLKAEIEGESEESVSDSEISESEIESEDVQVSEDGDSLSAYLKEMKASHNTEPVDLTARVGEYVVWNEDDMELVEDPNSETYGFWQDITAGCSVWCAVNEYNVKATASSTLAPQGQYNYAVENILDGSKKDAWVEGVSGSGIGEKISITKSYSTTAGETLPNEESVFFYELCIVNGLAKTEKSWKENGRVKALNFYYNGTFMGKIELKDTMKPQYVSLSGLNLAAKNNEENTFTFEIADVYAGDKYDDTAITGIEIAFDSPNH